MTAINSVQLGPHRSKAVAMRKMTRSFTELKRWTTSQCPVFDMENRGSFKEMKAYFDTYLSERRQTGHLLKGMDYEAQLLAKSPDERKSLRDCMAEVVSENTRF